MFERKVQPGDHVIDQGDDGDNFYVIDKYVILWIIIEGATYNCHGCCSLKEIIPNISSLLFISHCSLIPTFLNPVCFAIVYFNYFFLL